MIYHIATATDWEAHLNRNVYSPSAFEKEGFIHNCELRQLNGVLERYFQGRSDLLLLCISEEKLTSPLKYEAATNGDMFPHIYGEINKDAIIKVIEGRGNFSLQLPKS